MDAGARRREVLAASADGSENPGRQGCLDRVSGRIEGLPEGAGAVLRPAPGAGEPELCELDRAQGGGGGSESGLPGRDGVGGRTAVGALCRAVERALPDHQQPVAAALGAGDSVFRVSSRDSEGDLHDERGGIAQHEPAESDQDARRLSKRRRSLESDLPGAAEADCEVGP